MTKITLWPKTIADKTGVTARYIQSRYVQGRSSAANLITKDAGRCDILVNNAGIQHVAGDSRISPVEKWDAIIAINMSSAFHTTAVAHCQ